MKTSNQIAKRNLRARGRWRWTLYFYRGVKNSSKRH